MIHSLRTLLWLRWRSLVHLLRAPGRSGGERGSRWLGVLLPALLDLLFAALGLLAAAACFLAVTSFVSGNPPDHLIIGLRVLTGLSVFLVILLPLERSKLRPSGAGSLRLQLIPLSRRHLLVGEIVSSLFDPWILLVAPSVLLLPISLAFHGRPTQALSTAATGLLFLLLLVALGLAVAGWVAWFLSSRRRTEAGALVGLILLVGISFLPGAILPESGQPSEGFFQEALITVFNLLPSEFYGLSVSGSLGGWSGDTHRGMLGLGVELLLALGLLAAAPDPSQGTDSRKRGRVELPAWSDGHLSGDLAAQAWAVAVGFLRTVRGRLALCLPPIVTAILVVMHHREEIFGQLLGGPDVAAAGILLGILSLAPVQLNQLAADQAGLGRSFLAPIGARRLLLGRALGIGIVALMATLPSLLVGALLVGDGHPARWLAMAVGIVSILAPLSVVGALCSVLLPKSTDLSSLAQKGNAHPLSAVVSLIILPLSAAPVSLSVAILGRLFGRYDLALALSIGWTVLVVGVSWLLVPPIATLLESRREVLLDVAESPVR